MPPPSPLRSALASASSVGGVGKTEDEKLPLLRSSVALSREVLNLLRATGDERHTAVHSDSGVEQEFFIIDREYYLRRPDLQFCGRTLVGAAPAKGQERSDQYFGDISERVSRFFEDAEIELWKLGIPLQCRHREVAPGWSRRSSQVAGNDMTRAMRR